MTYLIRVELLSTKMRLISWIFSFYRLLIEPTHIQETSPLCIYDIFATYTAQKMKFSIKDFFSKCDQIRSFHLLNKSLKADSRVDWPNNF